tara:strand:+ start:1736 stop:2341 length:606 start_codon:yes stop_codon:yes gene_type:complete
MLGTTSKLNAVNTMLSAVGEAPINSLTSNVTADVSLATSILDEISREVQSHGWHFNTVIDYPLIPDSTTNINLPTNMVRVDLEGLNLDPDFDIVVRGTKLYNRVNNSYVFTQTLKVTAVVLLEWDEMPEVAKRYIMIRAARVYQDRLLGSGKLHDFNRVNEQQAFMALREYEMDTADHNIFENDDVFRIINRGNIINRVRT